MRRPLIILLIIALFIGGMYFFYIRPKQLTGAPMPAMLKPFFPSSISSTDGSFGADSTTAPANASVASTAALKQLTGHPVAGYTVFSVTSTVSIPSAVSNSSAAASLQALSVKASVKNTALTQTVIDHYVRYVSRLNGYVYEIKNDGVPLQISNIFIPTIYEAQFADNNNTALLRFLRTNGRTIATYSVPIPALNPDGTRTQVSGVYLPDNISSLVVSPDQKQIARITTDQGGTIVTTSTTAGTGIKTIIRSSFQSWLPQWTAGGIYLQTKAASVADGFLYSVDLSASRLRRMLGNIAGLTTSVSPHGTYVLYSESTANGFVTKIFNTKTNNTSTLSLALLPEKCAWLQNEDVVCAGNSSVANAVYPDAWYAGTMHFSDQLYRINTASNIYSVLYNDPAQSFDMTNLQIDEGQGFVYFIDKTTGFLWQYKY
jgi:hypothetical protein